MLQVPKPQLCMPELNNWVATPGTATHGATVTAHATVNTKGSWAQIFAAATVTYDVFGISVMINNDSTSAAVTRNLYDIGIGGAGSEVVLIANILNTSPISTRGLAMREYFFPVFIPKGTRIAARKQSNITVKAGAVAMTLHGGGALAPWPTFSGADSYGTDTATSGGLAHTPGNTGAYSTWTNIGATLARDYHAIIPMVGTGSDTTMTALAVYLQIGISSTLLRHYCLTQSASEDVGWLYPVMPLYGHFATGTQMMLRATSNTTSEPLEFGFLAFY